MDDYLWFGIGGFLMIVGVRIMLSANQRKPKTGPTKIWNQQLYMTTRNVPSKPGKTKRTGLRYLVIGGNGCVGSHIVEQLLARGETDITVMDVANTGLFQGESSVKFISGDIRNSDSMKKLLVGYDIVHHTASLVDPGARLPFDYQRFYDVNIKGAQNVIDACIQNGVKKLIYTSSGSVLHSFNAGTRNGQDDYEYVRPPYVGHYPPTKAEAERLILGANGQKGLLTGAVRPTGVYGPRDLLILAGYAKPDLNIGMHTAYADMVYVENVAYGHLLVEEKVTTGSDAAGHAFIIGNEPTGTDSVKWNNRLASVMGGSIYFPSHKILWVVAYIIEGILRLTNGKYPKGDIRKLTPPTLMICETDFVMSLDKSRKVLGYKPLYNFDESFAQCKKWLDSYVARTASK